MTLWKHCFPVIELTSAHKPPFCSEHKSPNLAIAYIFEYSYFLTLLSPTDLRFAVLCPPLPIRSKFQGGKEGRRKWGSLPGTAEAGSGLQSRAGLWPSPTPRDTVLLQLAFGCPAGHVTLHTQLHGPCYLLLFPSVLDAALAMWWGHSSITQRVDSTTPLTLTAGTEGTGPIPGHLGYLRPQSGAKATGKGSIC